MKPNIAERTSRYIASGLHTGLCDKCIAMVVKAYPTQITLVCTALATTRDFARDRGFCDNCGRKRLVTRRLYRAAAP